MHDIVEKLFGRIVLPRYPINELEEPAVLDCGFGNGQWIDAVLKYTDEDAWVSPCCFACTQRPKAGCKESAVLVSMANILIQCVGIDIYTGEGNSEEDSDEEDSGEEGVALFVKKRWNLNASFKTSRDPDLRPETFHLINSRFLTDGLNAGRWQEYVKELKDLLKPGGWLQMVETHNLFQSDSGQTPAFLERWWQYYQDTMTRMGKNPRVGPTLGVLMTTAR